MEYSYEYVKTKKIPYLDKNGEYAMKKKFVPVYEHILRKFSGSPALVKMTSKKTFIKWLKLTLIGEREIWKNLLGKDKKKKKKK